MQAREFIPIQHSAVVIIDNPTAAVERGDVILRWWGHIIISINTTSGINIARRVGAISFRRCRLFHLLRRRGAIAERISPRGRRRAPATAARKTRTTLFASLRL